MAHARAHEARFQQNPNSSLNLLKNQTKNCKITKNLKICCCAARWASVTLNRRVRLGRPNLAAPQAVAFFKNGRARRAQTLLGFMMS